MGGLRGRIFAAALLAPPVLAAAASPAAAQLGGALACGINPVARGCLALRMTQSYQKQRARFVVERNRHDLVGAHLAYIQAVQGNELYARAALREIVGDQWRAHADAIVLAAQGKFDDAAKRVPDVRIDWLTVQTLLIIAEEGIRQNRRPLARPALDRAGALAPKIKGIFRRVEFTCQSGQVRFRLGETDAARTALAAADADAAAGFKDQAERRLRLMPCAGLRAVVGDAAKGEAALDADVAAARKVRDERYRHFLLAQAVEQWTVMNKRTKANALAAEVASAVPRLDPYTAGRVMQHLFRANLQ